MCTQCTLCAGSGGRGTSTHTVHSCYCNTLTHLVLVLLVFDPSMKWTLEHKPTYMVCAVEPAWGKREGKRRKERGARREERRGGRREEEGGEKRKERGKEEGERLQCLNSPSTVYTAPSLLCHLPPMSPPSHVTSLPCHLPITNLAIGSATLFPSNLAMVSLSGKGSTQHAWMSGGGPVKQHIYHVHTCNIISYSY